MTLASPQPAHNLFGMRLHRTARMSRGRKCLVMIACMCLQAIAAGSGYGLGIMYPELIRVFNVTSTEAALVQSVYLGISIGCGILWTGLMRRFGSGYFPIIGGLLGCAGAVISALAPNVTTIIIGTGFVAGTGMSMCFLAPYIIITILMKDNTSVYLVFVAVGSSVGQCVIPYVFETFLHRYNWSGTFLIIGGVALQCVVLGTFLQCVLIVDGEIRKENKDTDTDITCKDSEPTVRKGNVLVLILTDIVVLMLLVNFFVLALTGNIEAWFITDMLVSRGYSREAGSDIVSMNGASSVLSRIVAGLIKMKCNWPTAYYWVYILAITALGHGLVIYFTDYTAIFVTCVVYTLFYGTTLAHGPVIMLEAVGLEKFPVAVAMINITYGLGNFFGGVFGGYIKETYGTYNNLFYFGIAGSLYICLTTVVVIFIMRHRQRRDGTGALHQNRYETD